MNIGFDARMYGLKHAGIGRYVQNLLTQLAKIDRKNSYTLVTQDKKDLTDVPQNSQIIETNIRHYSLAEQTSFFQLINNLNVDLFHFPHFNVPLLYRKPYVVTIHDLLWHEKVGFNATTLNPVKYLFKYLGYRLVINNSADRAKKIICPTHWVKQQVVNKLNVGNHKVSVTYEAADAHFFDKLIPQPFVLSKYQLAKPYIIYTGSLYPHKNVNNLVEAIKPYPQVQLGIASARNIFFERFKSYVIDHNQQEQVKLLGFVPDTDLKQLYLQATALILPSLSEGFGLTGLEAMAVGTPVICHHHPVLKEIYKDAALFTDASNPDTLGKTIIALLDNKKLASKLTMLGKKQATVYSWRKMARETLDIYNQV